MQYALTPSGEKILATERRRDCVCPCCHAGVVPHLGEIKIEHWQHQAAGDCDPWFEGESAWHFGWKSRFPSSRVEVPMQAGQEARGHRADVVTARGRVLELQHSSISPAEIAEREAFYLGFTGKPMMWLFDASEFEDNVSLYRNAGKDGRVYYTFRWRWPRLTHTAVKSDLFWDFRGAKSHEPRRVIHIRKLYGTGGWGYALTVQEFLKRLGEAALPVAGAA